MTKQPDTPEWETLLAHAALLQTKLPAAILVGGTAAALHAGHRISFDHDHVIAGLAKNYDAAILALESIAGDDARLRSSPIGANSSALPDPDQTHPRNIAGQPGGLRRSAEYERFDSAEMGNRAKAPHRHRAQAATSGAENGLQIVA